MHNQKIIIGIGGNIKSEDGDHPIKVAMKAISYLKDYSIALYDLRNHILLIIQSNYYN